VSNEQRAGCPAWLVSRHPISRELKMPNQKAQVFGAKIFNLSFATFHSLKKRRKSNR
jgi:hypothetical protein